MTCSLSFRDYFDRIVNLKVKQKWKTCSRR